jgi:predicted acetyltransferase
MRLRIGDGLWVRLVDVGAALSARSYAADGTVVFDVIDEFCPWNEGRWRLADGRAKRTTAAAQLRCDVRMLGSVYLGGFSFSELVRGGRVEELRRGAAARADALFATDRAPWCPEIF